MPRSIEPDDREWNSLAGNQLDRAQRTDHELLERAHFPLTHDRERGQQQCHEHDDGAHHRRHIVVAAIQVGIEPGALAQIDETRGPRTNGLERERLHDAFDISSCHRRDVRVRAIEQHLHSGTLTGYQIRGEPGRNLHAHHGVATVQRPRQIRRTIGAPHDLKVARRRQRLDERPRRRRLVVVHDERSRVADVRGDGVAEHHELDDRGHEDDHAQAGVSENLTKLFADQLDDAFDGAHQSSSFLNVTIASVTPTMANPIMSQPCTRSTSTPTPFRKMPRVTTRKYLAGTA